VRDFINATAYRFALRKIFGFRREEVGSDRGCRKLHKEEMNNLCASPDVVKVIKLKVLKWERHVVRIQEDRSV
jgi:hypothetical protein